MSNAFRVENIQPGQALYYSYPGGKLRILVVDVTGWGTFAGLAVRTETGWRGPSSMMRTSARDLQDWTLYARVSVDGEINPIHRVRSASSLNMGVQHG